MVAIGLGLYSFAGFSPLETNNIPIPNVPFVPGSEDIDNRMEPDMDVNQSTVSMLVAQGIRGA